MGARPGPVGRRPVDPRVGAARRGTTRRARRHAQRHRRAGPRPGRGAARPAVDRRGGPARHGRGRPRAHRPRHEHLLHLFRRPRQRPRRAHRPPRGGRRGRRRPAGRARDPRRVGPALPGRASLRSAQPHQRRHARNCRQPPGRGVGAPTRCPRCGGPGCPCRRHPAGRGRADARRHQLAVHPPTVPRRRTARAAGGAAELVARPGGHRRRPRGGRNRARTAGPRRRSPQRCRAPRHPRATRGAVGSWCPTRSRRDRTWTR